MKTRQDQDIAMTTTTLGNILPINESDNVFQNVVEMSESNFKKLIAMIPKTNEYRAVKNEIRQTISKLTELDFSTTAVVNADAYICILEERLESIKFQQDINEFCKQSNRIKVIGKINLEQTSH